MARRIATGSGRLVRVTGLVERTGRPPVEVRAAWRGRTRGRRRRSCCCCYRGSCCRRRRIIVGIELCIELGGEMACIEICKVGRIGERLEEGILAGDNLGFYALQQRELTACARHACTHVTPVLHQRASRVPTKIPEAGT